MIEKTFAERLLEVIGDEDPTPWATARGISGATVHEWLKKGVTPYPKSLDKLVAATGRSKSWWLTGRDAPGSSEKQGDLSAIVGMGAKADAITNPTKNIHASYPRSTATRGEARDNSGEYAAIPLYNGVRAAAGAGAVVESEAPDDMLMFKAEWVRIELGARPQDLYLIRVSGDSMEPTLRAGDVILVDRRAIRPDREGVYILRLNDVLIVKRLQALPGGKLRVVSDNPAFAPFEVPITDVGEELQIIGRVVWVGRRI